MRSPSASAQVFLSLLMAAFVAPALHGQQALWIQMQDQAQRQEQAQQRQDAEKSATSQKKKAKKHKNKSDASSAKRTEGSKADKGKE